jgi:2-alkyl-3-oxoalkanoate reductase
MKRVLITGATGFLGGAAARALLDSGWEVIATGRNAAAGERLRHEGCQFHHCELPNDSAILRRLATGCEAIVHCAALSSPWGARADFVRSNVEATREVLAACRDSGARLVYISSPSVSFGFSHQMRLREDAPWPEPAANDYIATKREAERLVRNQEEVPAIILRPKALIGPGDTTLLPRVIRTAQRGFFPSFKESDPLLDLTWIGDAAQAIELALAAGASCRGRIYHLTSGSPIRVSEAFALLFEACGLPVRFVPVSTRHALATAAGLEKVSRLFTGGRWEPPLTRYTVGSLAFEQSLDISAARADLGYLPQTDIRAALRECGRLWRERENSST